MYSINNNPPDIFGSVADYINLHVYTSENWCFSRVLGETQMSFINDKTFLLKAASQNTSK